MSCHSTLYHITINRWFCPTKGKRAHTAYLFASKQACYPYPQHYTHVLVSIMYEQITMFIKFFEKFSSPHDTSSHPIVSQSKTLLSLRTFEFVTAQHMQSSFISTWMSESVSSSIFPCFFKVETQMVALLLPLPHHGIKTRWYCYSLLFCQRNWRKYNKGLGFRCN